MILYVSYFLLVVIESTILVSGQGGPRQNQLRLARDDKSLKPTFNGADVIYALIRTRSLDQFGGSQLIRTLDPLTGGQITKSVDQLATDAALDNFKGGEVIAVLDRLTGGDILGSLESVEGMEVLEALEKSVHAHGLHQHPKRTLDTLTGMAFGLSKRFDSLSGSTFGMSKRDFDEIDNVGFTGFAKRAPGGRGRGSTLALAKKNFDEIDRAGFEGYEKKNFDEIDRAGFESFEKRGKK
ncbi:hypothetical protein JTE90_003094 [Oedothorax gibbosus]|uniref:Orcokinin n=1 Tax=Oedothorax gibbosus TaxID=931172 RepID=A0AAV6VDI6_9ARAC|nr:hypothetical protein JTE90_003094 [Oedothorax gibbosus]